MHPRKRLPIPLIEWSHTLKAIQVIPWELRTHGGKTDANAHSHTDYKNRVAVVRDGTINSE